MEITSGPKYPTGGDIYTVVCGEAWFGVSYATIFRGVETMERDL